MTESGLILYDKKEKIAVLTFNRPAALNALNTEVNLALIDLLDKAEADPDIRVIVLTGSGDKAFVAGADIIEMMNMSAMQARLHAIRAKRVTDKIWNLSKPVIAAVNGFCLGGGLEYALACDLRVASEKARFGLPEISLGILPGGGGTQRLPRLIGMTKAKELCLTGDMINAAQALELGLVNSVAPAESLMEKALELAAKIAGKSPTSANLIKTAMNKGIETDLETALMYEIDSFGLCFTTDEQRNGMAAFAAKSKK